MPLATVTDVQSRLGRTLSPEEQDQAAVLLGDAEVRLKARIPDLLDQVASGSLDEAVVVQVEANMVARVLRNPDGYVAETDGNYSYQKAQDATAGRLMVLDDEWSLLGLRRGMVVLTPRLELPVRAGPDWWWEW
ncbi:Gp19/Gp15/Gp42 family protein [Amycolatopsis cihanbeyliensis]|uniref:Gp19/Gp15/Gp42-like protein n=1 Tax=Amycolatopsis cihanbeyliensis TaxID=1128664 RepID=A0A542DNL8_AMYCI|nr:Gp19/Gp15/Gp42 family protein [Amycolatopsis cihanbeyliensis]TQJ04690.1 Gp19/Gp15/Gp42-like protein [Amycolatopsis cihanbeyliensis]